MAGLPRRFLQGVQGQNPVNQTAKAVAMLRNNTSAFSLLPSRDESLKPYKTASYRSMMAFKEAVDYSAGWKTPELSGARVLTKQGKVSVGRVLFSGAPVARPDEGSDEQEEEEEDEDEDDEGFAIDAQLTFINAALFVSVLAGWKGLWDLQDLLNVPWAASVFFGLALFFMRLRLDYMLDTTEVHNDWFGEVENLPDFSMSTAQVYLQTFTVGFVSFISTISIWRGVWTALDKSRAGWAVLLCVGTVAYIGLTLVQRQITKMRIRMRRLKKWKGEEEDPILRPLFSNLDWERAAFNPEVFVDDDDEEQLEEGEEDDYEALEELRNKRARDRREQARQRSESLERLERVERERLEKKEEELLKHIEAKKAQKREV